MRIRGRFLLALNTPFPSPLLPWSTVSYPIPLPTLSPSILHPTLLTPRTPIPRPHANTFKAPTHSFRASGRSRRNPSGEGSPGWILTWRVWSDAEVEGGERGKGKEKRECKADFDMFHVHFARSMYISGGTTAARSCIPDFKTPSPTGVSTAVNMRLKTCFHSTRRAGRRMDIPNYSSLRVVCTTQNLPSTSQKGTTAFASGSFLR